MRGFLRAAESMGSLGAVISAMGCAMCFPALAGLGAALGLGFPGRWEGLFVNTLLPLFARVVLIADTGAVLGHRLWRRTVLNIVGPVLLLLSLYPLFRYAWSSYVTYFSLILMIVVSLWDILSPANRCCAYGCSSGRG